MKSKLFFLPGQLLWAVFAQDNIVQVPWDMQGVDGSEIRQGRLVEDSTLQVGVHSMGRGMVEPSDLCL